MRLLSGLLQRCCSVRLVLLVVAPPTPVVAPSTPLKEGCCSAQRQALKLVLLVEDGVWPEYTLHEEGTWAAHRKLLSLEQRHAEVQATVRAHSCFASQPTVGSCQKRPTLVSKETYTSASLGVAACCWRGLRCPAELCSCRAWRA